MNINDLRIGPEDDPKRTMPINARKKSDQDRRPDIESYHDAEELTGAFEQSGMHENKELNIQSDNARVCMLQYDIVVLAVSGDEFRIETLTGSGKIPWSREWDAIREAIIDKNIPGTSKVMQRLEVAFKAALEKQGMYSLHDETRQKMGDLLRADEQS